MESLKSKKLTRKQKGFVKDYEGLGTGSITVKKHYEVSTDETARAIAYENLTKPHIQQALAERIPDDLLGEKHLALLNKKEVIVRNNVTSGEIETIPTGEIDVQAVVKGLDMAYKLKGSYAPEKSPGQVNILMPVLVKFLDKNERANKTDNNRDTDRISETL